MGKSSLIKSTTKNKRLSDKSQKKDRAEIEKIDVKLNEHIAVVEEIEEGKNEQIGIQGDPKSDIITSFNYFNDETINNLD